MAKEAGVKETLCTRCKAIYEHLEKEKDKK